VTLPPWFSEPQVDLTETVYCLRSRSTERSFLRLAEPRTSAACHSLAQAVLLPQSRCVSSWSCVLSFQTLRPIAHALHSRLFQICTEIIPCAGLLLANSTRRADDSVRAIAGSSFERQ
jgi:transcriptional regulator GlxA family with amidase domain